MNDRMKHILLLLLLLAGRFPGQAQNAMIDSLRKVLETETTDTVLYKTRVELGRQYILISEYDRADSLSFFVLEQAGQALSSTTLSAAVRTCILKAQSKSYNTLGVTAMYRGDQDRSIKYHLQALAIREKMNDRQGISASHNNIGNLYLQKGDFDKAMESYRKSARISEELQDKFLMSLTYNNIGLIYQDKNQFDSALVHLQKALKLREELGNKQFIAASYNNMAIVSFALKDYRTAEEFYFKSLNIMKEMGDKMSMAVAYNNIGNLYLKQHKAIEAKKMQLLSLELGKQINSKPTTLLTYASLAQCDSALGDFKGAYGYQKMYGVINDSIFNEESDKSMQEMQAKYETEKKENEIKLLTKDGELMKTQARIQKVIIGSIVTGLLLVILFAVLIFNRLQLTRKQKQIIEEQKVLVDQKNKHITDSINYAKRIQDSILPSREEFKRCFSGHFLFFRPKDIVSGDFYWLSELRPPSGSPGGRILLVVADCTGHGVPGAFMSMIGNTLLNEIVNEQHITQPAEILNHLNEGIIQALHQESRTQDDGMDVSVCLFDKEENKITFAGANHSLYIAQEGSILEIKGDIYSIGSMFGPRDASGTKTGISFTQKEIILKKNATVFFSTDGFPDQIGGEKGEKFMLRQMEKMLQSVSSLEFNEQEEKIVNAFDAWKGKYPQLDDVLLVGIKP